jgi:hypothetical protein
MHETEEGEFDVVAELEAQRVQMRKQPAQLVLLPSEQWGRMYFAGVLKVC